MIESVIIGPVINAARSLILRVSREECKENLYHLVLSENSVYT